MDLRGRRIAEAVKLHDTAALFDWLVEFLSFQGISDFVASSYIADHGSVRWSDIDQALSRTPSCSKLIVFKLFLDIDALNCGTALQELRCVTRPMFFLDWPRTAIDLGF